MATPLPEPRWYAIGPHGFYDLVRLARRGRSSLVRIGYLAALFAALAVVYHTESRARVATVRLRGEVTLESINTNARIAERFSITILVMQNIAVLVLMPIYMAASVQEERDKHTLPILFTTHLSAREIVQGKWLARVGHVGSVLLGGLPVLSFAQLWGGIDMPMIAANFCNTGFWLISTAGFSAMMATQSRTLMRSLVKTYLLMLGVGLIFTCCCMPWDFRGDLAFLLRPIGDAEHSYFRMWLVLGLLGLLHVGLTASFLRKAAHNLDAQRGQEIAPEWIDTELAPLAADGRREQRPVSDHALIWKECRVEPPIWNLLPYGVLLFLFCITLGYMMTRLPHTPAIDYSSLRNQYQGVFTFCLFLCLSVYALQVVFRLAGTIVRERERLTLESLLTLPMDRLELLTGKLFGNLMRYWVWLLPVAITWLILAVERISNPLPGLLLLAALAIHLGFLAMLALFLSVVCRTSIAAYVALGLMLLLIVIGTFFLATLIRPMSDELWHYGLNPVGCWLTIASAWRGDNAAPENTVIYGLITYAIAALVLGFLTYWRFEHREK